MASLFAKIGPPEPVTTAEAVLTVAIVLGGVLLAVVVAAFRGSVRR